VEVFESMPNSISLVFRVGHGFIKIVGTGGSLCRRTMGPGREIGLFLVSMFAIANPSQVGVIETVEVF